ncbi:MAG: hypothetical protein ACYC8T_13955 [Myxococcaceae bacterium]
MAQAETPYWVLISVLFSSQPLSEKLAMELHRVAYELYRSHGSEGAIDGELVHGTVRNKHKDALIGTIGGPVFEAEVETERGSGQVRFLLTRQGLELLSHHKPRKKKRPLLN